MGKTEEGFRLWDEKEGKVWHRYNFSEEGGRVLFAANMDLEECPLSKEELLRLVEEEAALRISASFLEQVEQEEREGKTDGTVAIVQMQEDLVKRHGHPVEMVDVLRSARMWYPGVQEFWEIPVQVKHNIMSEGALSHGDLLPDVTLWTLGGSQVKLKKSGIQVILASSYS